MDSYNRKMIEKNDPNKNKVFYTEMKYLKYYQKHLTLQVFKKSIYHKKEFENFYLNTLQNWV